MLALKGARVVVVPALATLGKALMEQGKATEAEGYLRQALEQPLAGAVDWRQLAVHQLLRPDDLAAERLSDGLVTKANAPICITLATTILPVLISRATLRSR